MTKLTALTTKAATFLRLGVVNLVRVAGYRALLRSGYYRRRLPIMPSIRGPFFDWSKQTSGAHAATGGSAALWVQDAERVTAGELKIFSSRWVDCGFPPNWSRSVISQTEADVADRHWTRIPDFGLPGGDIKGYWEIARFDGLLVLTLGWLSSRREDLRTAIESWLQSWCQFNPANSGVQWKCGQETALRILQTLLAAELLQRWSKVEPSEAFCELVSQHCLRIAPTMMYAIGQENNHGTSEAAALFVGGSFLLRQRLSRFHPQATRWQETGRRWLEDRMRNLVLPDGSFSQHSVNYHRLMLDTCSLTETLRRQWGVDGFSEQLYERFRAATNWLAAMTDPSTGDAPNLGANDGARVFVLHRSAYRDFRPSVQWAAALCLDRRQYQPGSHDELPAWLGLSLPEMPAASSGATARCLNDGGYIKLQVSSAWLLLRLPRYRFRPSQADALHLDMWIEGQNVLRDGGSFSYNAGAEWLNYFCGTASHNTVQFDGRDQMARVSRFLFADWLECSELEIAPNGQTVVAAYRDSWGACHRRTIRKIADSMCHVIDEVSGFTSNAILRWRLAPLESAWTLEDGACRSGRFSVRVQASVECRRQELVSGWESRSYAEKTPLPVFETEVASAATLTTTITW